MFLHGWAIVMGVLAVGLPVLIHFLTRPRPARFPLSTLRFVREAIQQRRARHRLRDYVILALRTAAVCLFAAAMARPFWGGTEVAAIEDNVDTLRVVIVDVSQSMAAEANGVVAFERGRAVASDQLDYRPGLKVNLLLAGAKPSAVFTSPSTNFAALRDAMAQANPLPQQLNLSAAITMAAEMLAAGGDDVRRELVVISDFQRTNWAAADFSDLPKSTVIKLESVAGETPLPNLAILRVAGQGRLQLGQEGRLEVDVGNFSETPRQVRVEVTLGNALYQLSGNCPPQTTTTLTTDIVPRNLGWQTGTAQLVDVDDAAPRDNSRPCVIVVRSPPHYALITGQAESLLGSSSYYLQRGLVPGSTGRSQGRTRVTRLAPGDMNRDTLGSAELLVIDHPGKFTDEQINLLASLLRRGHGILYVASEAIDATNLKRLTDAAGTSVRLPVEFVPAAAGRPRHDLFLTDIQRTQPPFSIFGENLTSLVSPLRFSGGLETRGIEGALADEVWATFNDQSAFLVGTSSEAGNLVVLNAALGRSNLVGSPLFVPLLGEVVQRLLTRDRQHHDLQSGEPVAVFLPAEAGGVGELELAGPTAEAQVGELLGEPGGVMWRTTAAGRPGVYKVRRDGETVFASAITIPAVESDLRSMPAEVLQERLAGGRDIRFRSVVNFTGDEQDVLWTYLAIACIGCLMGEIVALRLFRT